MLYNALIETLKKDGFSLDTMSTSQKPRKSLRRRFTINRFPIACTIGYKLALKAGYSDKLAKALGYGMSLAPNIAKKAVYSARYYNGVPMSHKGNKLMENEERLMNQGVDYEIICFPSRFRWEFIKKPDNSISLARMKSPQFWTDEDYNKAISKLSPAQIKKLYQRIDKELGKISVEEFGYRYCKNYKTFFQPLMDRLRTNL